MTKVLAAMTLIVLPLCASSWAQDKNPPVPPSAASAAAPMPQPTPNPEVALLQSELATVRSYDDKLLATVHWALGIVVTVVLVMAGFGWYANFRSYDRDKLAMRTEFESEIANRWRELTERVAADLGRQASASRDARDALAKEVQNKLAEIGRSLQESVARTEKKAAQDIRDLRMQFVEFRSDDARDGKDYSAYSSHRSLLQIALEMERETPASKALDRIIKVLQSREGFFFDDIADLRRIAEKLPLGLAPYKDSLLQVLAQLKLERTGL